jgi:hypothetical protein
LTSRAAGSWTEGGPSARHQPEGDCHDKCGKSDECAAEESPDRGEGGPGDVVIVDVPVQYYQSVIAVEVAVIGVLLFQIRFFDTGNDGRTKSDTDPRLRLLMLVVLTATVFGSLEGIRERGGLWTAVLVTVGLAISALPILLQVLPPLRRDVLTQQRDPNFWFAVLGLILYAAVIAVAVSID